jgi:RES domain-containing protein
VNPDGVAVEGVWWRQVPYGGDPLFRADPPSDGRWQRGETVGGMYFADDEPTAWAEWYRVLAEFAIPPDRHMPRDLWRWQVSAQRVADLSDALKLAAVELTPPRPSQREWATSQAVGERLWRAGYSGVLAPSAARPESLVLCLFRDTDEISSATPLRPPTTYRRAPPPPTGKTT